MQGQGGVLGLVPTNHSFFRDVAPVITLREVEDVALTVHSLSSAMVVSRNSGTLKHLEVSAHRICGDMTLTTIPRWVKDVALRVRGRFRNEGFITYGMLAVVTSCILVSRDMALEGMVKYLGMEVVAAGAGEVLSGTEKDPR